MKRIEENQKESSGSGDYKKVVINILFALSKEESIRL
jgi:hypothetical protein